MHTRVACNWKAITKTILILLIMSRAISDISGDLNIVGSEEFSSIVVLVSFRIAM